VAGKGDIEKGVKEVVREIVEGSKDEVGENGGWR